MSTVRGLDRSFPCVYARLYRLLTGEPWAAGGKQIPSHLTIHIDFESPDVAVSLEGELDTSNAPELERVLDELVGRPARRVVLDLRRLSFSDAAGLRVIERAGRGLGTRLIVCGPQPPVRRVIHLTGLDELVNVEGDAGVEVSDPPASNATYVSQLWDAYAKGGAERFASLVPDDVEWKSAWSGGRVLHGTDELLEFWRSRPGPKITPSILTAVGVDVLITWRLEDGEPKELWSIYRFEGRRLVEAETFEREAEAIAALELTRRR